MIKIGKLITMLVLCALGAACGPALPAAVPDEAAAEQGSGPDAAFAEALTEASASLAAAHTAIAFANRAANAAALDRAGPSPEARRAAVLAVYEDFFPIWRVYGAARDAYAAAASLADAEGDAGAARRLQALVDLVQAGEDLVPAVEAARGLAYEPDGAP